MKKDITIIETFTRNMTKEQFVKSVKTQYSVIRGIEIIGEATKNIPNIVKNRYSDIPWKDIVGMRDKLIHDYFGVNMERVWGVVKDDMPILKGKIKKILEDVEKRNLR